MIVLYLEIALAFAIIQCVRLGLGLADPPFNRAIEYVRHVLFSGLFWPVVAFIWVWSLIYKTLVYLVAFLFFVLTGNTQAKTPTVTGTAGWLNIISFVATVAVAWQLVSRLAG